MFTGEVTHEEIDLRDRAIPDRTPSGRPPAAITRAGAYAFSCARLLLALTFLWAFGDKLFGWDHATPAAKSWLAGGSPTAGFLSSAQGPFADVMHGLAGNAIIDRLFMAGLLGIGIALLLGVGMRIAAISATLLLLMMWAGSLPIKTHPFIDQHLVFAATIIGLALTRAGDRLSLARWWSGTRLVRRLPILR